MRFQLSSQAPDLSIDYVYSFVEKTQLGLEILFLFSPASDQAMNRIASNVGKTPCAGCQANISQALIFFLGEPETHHSTSAFEYIHWDCLAVTPRCRRFRDLRRDCRNVIQFAAVPELEDAPTRDRVLLQRTVA